MNLWQVLTWLPLDLFLYKIHYSNIKYKICLISMRSSPQKNKLSLVNYVRKNLALSYSLEFQPLKYRFSLWASKEPKIQQHCHQFEWHSITKPHVCGNIPSKGFRPWLPTTNTPTKMYSKLFLSDLLLMTTILNFCSQNVNRDAETEQEAVAHHLHQQEHPIWVNTVLCHLNVPWFKDVC